MVQTDEARAPAANGIRVRIHASSLKRYDYNVALGVPPVEDERIMMSDGVRIVEAMGMDVREFAMAKIRIWH